MTSPTSTQPHRRLRRPFYGWWIVLAATVASFLQGSLFLYGLGALFTPIRDDLGWTRTELSLAVSLATLAGGVAGPFMGHLIDRFGPRLLQLIATFSLGLGFILLSQAHSLLIFYAVFLLFMGIGYSVSGIGLAPTAAVANWFVRRRGRALGVYSLGYALAGLMSPPFFWLIETVGWRTSFQVVGLVTWVLIPLAVFVMRRRPEDYGLFPDGDDAPPPRVDETSAVSETSSGEVNLTARQAVRTRAFWLLAAGSSLAFLTIAALQVHWTPYMESVGFSRQAAAFFLPLVPLSTVIGRIGFGFLADLWDKRRATALAFTLQAGAIILLAFLDASRPWMVFLFLALWGVGFGGTIVTRMALQGELFGRYSFGLLLGLLSMSSEAGFAFSPLIASLSFDALGTYRPVFLAFAVLTFLATPITLAIVRPKRPTSASPTATTATSTPSGDT